MLYQGFFETSAGMRKAYLQKEEATMVLVLDQNVVDDWKVTEIQDRALILKDVEGNELRLDFNKAKQVEVKIDPKKK